MDWWELMGAWDFSSQWGYFKRGKKPVYWWCIDPTIPINAWFHPHDSCHHIVQDISMVFSLCPDLPIISPRLSHFFWPSCECSCATFQWSCLTAACELEAMAHLARKLRNHQRVTISNMGQQFWAIQGILKWMNLAFPSCLWFWHKILATLLKAVPNDWGICAMARVPTWGNELPPYTGDTTDS